MCNNSDLIAHYEMVGRERPLDAEESAKLERAIRRDMRRQGRVYFVWLPKHNLAIKRALRRPRPGTVAKLAEKFGINERAVWRQITRLRKAGQVGYISPENGTGRYPRKGSMAETQKVGV